MKTYNGYKRLLGATSDYQSYVDIADYRPLMSQALAICNLVLPVWVGTPINVSGWAYPFQDVKFMVGYQPLPATDPLSEMTSVLAERGFVSFLLIKHARRVSPELMASVHDHPYTLA